MSAWLPTKGSGDRGFRNRAKLVVGGLPGSVTLGKLGPDKQGVDLRDCLIHEPEIRAVIPAIAEFLEVTGLAPYNVATRRGELKFVHVTAAPSGELMVRFVARTEHSLDQIRRQLPELRAALPQASVISVNLLPEHKALLEGDREEVLLGSALRMDMNDIPLYQSPQSFFQTNTEVARELYSQAAAWVDECNPAALWDLYCGAGGFALACAGGSDRHVLGVETSEQAVRSARRSAKEVGVNAQFVAADATAYALNAPREQLPEVVIVNPPRRGIGAELAGWIERSGVDHVIYSSCNPESLATDLALMPTLEVSRARIFDMFPHTTHMEVMVLLRRVAPTARLN
ncbi:MAG: methyltransferase domain-containing protein [Leucobacter sp.]